MDGKRLRQRRPWQTQISSPTECCYWFSVKKWLSVHPPSLTHLSTKGTGVPGKFTKTVTNEWVIQGSSCWSVLNISVGWSACIPSLGQHFSFSLKKKKKSVTVVFYFIFSFPYTPLYNECNVEKLLQVATEGPLTGKLWGNLNTCWVRRFLW